MDADKKDELVSGLVDVLLKMFVSDGLFHADLHPGNIVFPASLMLHAKALISAEALLFQLAPDARFEQLSRPFIAREHAARATAPQTLAKRASQFLLELLLLQELTPQSAMDEEWNWTETKSLASDLATLIGLANGDTGRAFLRGLMEHHAKPILETVKPGLNVPEILAAAWQRYDVLEPDLPVVETVGAMMTTHLAALTLALHESVVAQDQSAEQGHEIVYQIGWSIYERMSKMPLQLAKSLTADPAEQMRVATDLFRQFPFGSPAYGWRDVDAGPGIVGFDCTKYPVATSFKDHDASDLCVQTWCSLDFPLTQKWGGHLERAWTIAMGRAHCEFRWHIESALSSSRPRTKETI